MPVQIPQDHEILALIAKADPTFEPPPWLFPLIKRLVNNAWKEQRMQDMEAERNHPPILQFAIPKQFLRDGCYYAGKCRNAHIARWNAERQEFVHWRTKFDRVFIETIEYWDTEGKFDGFIPLFCLGDTCPQEIPIAPIGQE